MDDDLGYRRGKVEGLGTESTDSLCFGWWEVGGCFCDVLY